MFEIAAVAGPDTSANKSGKWRQGKSESWPLFGGDSTFFSQQQQPRSTEETTSEKRKSSGGGFGDDGVPSGRCMEPWSPTPTLGSSSQRQPHSQ